MHLTGRTVAMALALIGSVTVSIAHGAPMTLPAGFEHTEFARGLAFPSSIVFAPDGRLFAVGLTGDLVIVEHGGARAPAFLSLPVGAGGERGMKGLAFDPDFARSGYLYVFYTSSANVGRISRFSVSAHDANRADASSEIVMLDGIDHSGGTHLGGAIRFGADGMLYVATGDISHPVSAQDLTSLNGKMLRLDVRNYPDVIPHGNPFLGHARARPELFALGFRNPFTFAVDPATDSIVVNDVGDNNWEEINLLEPGGNYGWPACEGACRDPLFKDPIFAYDHAGQSASIAGGVWHHAIQFPAELRGYFFADFVQRFIRIYRFGESTIDFVTDTEPQVVSIESGPDGSLYYLSLDLAAPNSKIFKIQYIGTANRPPNAAISADTLAGLAPLGVTFSAAASTDADNDPLLYAWDFGDHTTGSGVLITHVYTHNGSYRVALTVDDGHGNSDTESVTITVGAVPPGAFIDIPVDGELYSAGDTIHFHGSSNVPDVTFGWVVLFHHGSHDHSFLGPVSGPSGSFVVPRTGETAIDVYYRLIMTVTSAAGISSVAERRIDPRTAAITLTSIAMDVPASLKVALDGIPVATPAIIRAVVGMTRSIDALYPQAFSGKIYTLNDWTGIRAKSIVFNMPAQNIAVNANYVEVPPCNGKTATIYGTGYADLINGTPSDDVIVALGGADYILAGGGNDTVCAGSGNDGISGGSGSDVILGGDGDDRMSGNSGADGLVGGPGHDVITGDSGADYIDGGSGMDYIDGGDANDYLLGSAGADTIVCSAGDDFADGGTETDTADACEMMFNIP